MCENPQQSRPRASRNVFAILNFSVVLDCPDLPYRKTKLTIFYPKLAPFLGFLMNISSSLLQYILILFLFFPSHQVWCLLFDSIFYINFLLSVVTTSYPHCLYASGTTKGSLCLDLLSPQCRSFQGSQLSTMDTYQGHGLSQTLCPTDFLCGLE